MKHASPATLERIAPLLAMLRDISALSERKPGVFYRKSQAFAHFHEDFDGMFGDIKTAEGWSRYPVDTADQQEHFMRAVRSTA